MKYKDYEFPSNPKKLEIVSKRNVGVSNVFDNKSAVENICDYPTVVSGSGEIYSSNAQEECEYISRLLHSKEAGWLFCPGIYPIKAFFTEFVYTLNSTKSCAEYSFVFTEQCDDTLYEKEVDYVVALDGENAFDIANRANISVSEIMKANDFCSPFEINAGERVFIK